MNKRIQKRHERQVSRAKERVRVSEPDLRTPDQVRAAREASRPTGLLSNYDRGNCLINVAASGWMNQRHLHVIDYLREENRVAA